MGVAPGVTDADMSDERRGQSGLWLRHSPSGSAEQSPVSARSVPDQCPISARSVPDQCPMGFLGKCAFPSIQNRAFSSPPFFCLPKTRKYRKNPSGTDRALIGHRSGTDRAPWCVLLPIDKRVGCGELGGWRPTSGNLSWVPPVTIRRCESQSLFVHGRFVVNTNTICDRWNFQVPQTNPSCFCINVTHIVFPRNDYERKNWNKWERL